MCTFTTVKDFHLNPLITVTAVCSNDLILLFLLLLLFYVFAIAPIVCGGFVFCLGFVK